MKTTPFAIRAFALAALVFAVGPGSSRQQAAPTTKAAPTATLKADYRFEGNLNSSVGTMPALTNLVASGNAANTFVNDTVDGYQRQVLSFPLNNGISLNNISQIVPNPASMTVVILFKFGAVGGKRRLFDTSAGTAGDSGGYFLDGKIEGENTTHAPTDANSYFTITFVRGGNGVLTIYRDNVLAVTEADGGDPLASGLRFFQDWVGANPVQASGGSIARLRVFDGPLTVQEIHQLDRVPEAPSGAMPLLLYSNRSGVNDFYRMNTDGTSQKRLTNNEFPEINAKFSPDGQKIVYMRRETGADPFQIWTANADGSNPVRLTNTTTIDKVPAWRPDGQKIMFSRCNPSTGSCDLFTMNPDGTNQAAIATTATDEDLAVFTPNGQKIVFACSDANQQNYQICVSNADGSNRVAITNTTTPVVSQLFSVSPDGTRLACIQGSNPGNNVIKTMNLDGSGVVTWPTVNNPQFPLWSPDGTKILYSAIAGNQFEVFVANPDGTSPVRLTFNSALDIATDWYRPQAAARRAPFDFDGDGKSDLSIFRPAAGEWWQLRSSDDGNRAFQFGAPADVIAPADYTGDGKTDAAFFRAGQWFILRSDDSSFYAFPFGAATDVPVPADYDGDGKADPAVFRPSTATWFVVRSTDGGVSIIGFGLTGDRPVPADYDGDGKADIAIFRPDVGQWWISRSTLGTTAVTFGVSTDLCVPGDFTGDGKADVAFFRAGQWFILRSEDGSFYSFPFGAGTDLPAPADYDGDGKFDPAVFRPSDTNWYVLRSTAGTLIRQFGAGSDRPVANAFVR